MAHLEEIEFIIRPDGTVEEKVTGIRGSDCTTVTEAVESALGLVVRRDLRGEYYEQPDIANETVSAEN